jgi:hypothetical protein
MLVKTVAAQFYNATRAHLERLEPLRLGPACLDLSNGPDAHGLWDVCYLSKNLPQFQRLRRLELDNLSLDDNAAYVVLQAYAQPTCTVKQLDLSNNSIYHLDEIVDLTDVVCRLTHLNLAGNALGEFDVDYLGPEVSVGTCLTCGALAALLSQYTSLRHLDLNTNAFHDAEVRASS